MISVSLRRSIHASCVALALSLVSCSAQPSMRGVVQHQSGRTEPLLVGTPAVVGERIVIETKGIRSAFSTAIMMETHRVAALRPVGGATVSFDLALDAQRGMGRIFVESCSSDRRASEWEKIADAALAKATEAIRVASLDPSCDEAFITFELSLNTF